MEKTLFSIKSKLLSNPTIRKLLVNTNKNCLRDAAPTVEEADPHFYVGTIVDFGIDTENAISNCISIESSGVDILDNPMGAIWVVRITAFSKLDIVEMDDNRLRTYALAQEIVAAIDGYSTNMQGSIEFDSNEYKTIDGEYLGFTNEFSIFEKTEIQDY